jgi:hypothetical protein
MGFEHHGAIHGAFNKSLTKYLRRRGLLNLHNKDISGKSPIQCEGLKQDLIQSN